jgi:hypothetical protein
MTGMLKLPEKQSRWLAVAIGLVLVGLIGVIDYLTGDYSLLVFYLIPISLAAWFAGRWWGGFIALASGTARFVADYTAYTNVRLLTWNAVEEMIFLMIVAYLIALLRKALDSDRE